MEKNEILQRQLKDEELKTRQREMDRHETTVSKLKLFGDALRNSVSRMSNDPVEIISFFRSVEQLYKSLDVPRASSFGQTALERESNKPGYKVKP